MLIYGGLETLTGGYLYDRKLTEHLLCRGHQVEVISKPYRHYSRSLLDNFSFSLLQQLKQMPLDVLLQDELNHPAFILLNRLLRRYIHCPIIPIIHHLRSSESRPVWQNRLYRWVERCYLLTADGFVFNSQTTRRVVENLMNAKRPAVVAYPAGDRLPSNITKKEIVARAKQPGPLRLVFLGNLIRRKELHTLLAALEQIPSDKWTLTVIGSLTMDKRYVHAIRYQVARSELAKRVAFLGQLSDTELVARLRESHVLAVPSSYEGFGTVYLEGMGFGLPAIASTAGGAAEIITHGSNGFLVPPRDTATLIQHLHTLIEDRDRLLAMSFDAHRCYERHPTWQTTTEHILAFLQTMVKLKSQS
jgi:glycosyltransferase involved in cell wall biosynthesis